MTKKKAAPQNGTTSNLKSLNSTTPTVAGQCAEILSLLRHAPVLSLNLTADHAIPEAAARIHDLRNKGFNIETHIQPTVVFRGRKRKNVALYVLKQPEWSCPQNTNSMPTTEAE
jgi:Helix-turn-helix domain